MAEHTPDNLTETLVSQNSAEEAQAAKFGQAETSNVASVLPGRCFERKMHQEVVIPKPTAAAQILWKKSVLAPTKPRVTMVGA